MLHIQSLTKTYKTGDKALTDVSFDLPKGQVAGLIGPSGAGKSTLIRCINRLVQPTSGKVLLNGLDITALGAGDLRRARRRIGMIFQEYALVERLTVMENVLSGRLGYVPFWRSFTRRFPPEDIQRAFRLLDRVGLSAHVNKRADALSGGQRQRVSIARAIVRNAPILLLDEATSALDNESEALVQEALDTVMKGRTTIVIAHRLSTVVNADHIIVMEAGSIIEEGTHEQLLAITNGIYARFYTMQTARGETPDGAVSQQGVSIP